MQIKYADIPQWLQSSEFFSNLGSDEVDECIEIPEDCFRETSDLVSTAEDLTDILRVIRFWLVAEIPQSVLGFCYTNDWSVWNPVFVEIVGEGTPELVAVNLACRRTGLFSLASALSTGRPELITFWLSINLKCSEVNKHSFVHACRYGRLDLVDILLEREFPYHSYAFCAAAQYGQLNVLHYLHERGFPCDNRVQIFAARGGHLDCVTYLHSIGCSLLSEVTTEFAVPSHYAYLKKHYPSIGSMWAEDFSMVPPQRGYIDCLQFALNNGCPVDRFAIRAAVRYGLLDCLELLRQYDSHWDTETFAAAAGGGHLACLVYMHNHGSPTSAGAVYSAAANGHLHCLQYLHPLQLTRDFAGASFAAAHGHLRCLQFLHENGYAWNYSATRDAAKGGFLDCLIYLHTNGCAWTEDACESAAEGGHLSCLQYLHENGCPWNNKATASAAHFNHLDCLQYLHTSGCEWDRMAATDAAINGHLNSLRYALEHGCPHNIQHLVKAAAGEKCSLNCLKYLVEERGADVQLSAEVFGAAFVKGNLAHVQYLLEKGCECQSYDFIRPPFQQKLPFTDADFLRCIQLAVERGWQPNEEVEKFVQQRDFSIPSEPKYALPLCIAYLKTFCT